MVRLFIEERATGVASLVAKGTGPKKSNLMSLILLSQFQNLQRILPFMFLGQHKFVSAAISRPLAVAILPTMWYLA